MIIEGKISVISAIEGANRKVNAVLLRHPANSKEINGIKNLCADRKIPVRIFNGEEFNSYVSGRTHGGVAADVGVRGYCDVTELIAAGGNFNTIAVIEGIEDPFNYGYAVRSLYSLGCGGLAVMKRDFSNAEPTILKASTGTFDLLPICQIDNDSRSAVISALKAAGYKFYCFDSSDSAENIYNVTFCSKSVFVIGGEKRGISAEFTAAADVTVRIPYGREFAHSMTIQAAATVAMYELNRQKSLKIDGDSLNLF